MPPRNGAVHQAGKAPPLTDADDKDPMPPDDELDVVIDLLAEDALLREALRKPMAVRLPTGKVISVPHQADWHPLASRAAVADLWEMWAKDVMSEDDFEAFREANLRHYQIKRIFEGATAAGDVTPGKPSRSSGSRGSSRKR